MKERKYIHRKLCQVTFKQLSYIQTSQILSLFQSHHFKFYKIMMLNHGSNQALFLHQCNSYHSSSLNFHYLKDSKLRVREKSFYQDHFSVFE